MLIFLKSPNLYDVAVNSLVNLIGDFACVAGAGEIGDYYFVITLEQVGDLAGVTDGSDDAVAELEKLVR